ncbi:3211_t:CDS:2, partial [Rhizophagus irregularis]
YLDTFGRLLSHILVLGACQKSADLKEDGGVKLQILNFTGYYYN